MKQFYLLILLTPIFSLTRAQFCNTCTTTITGNNSTPQIVGSGQTLCIAAGATLSGDILVQGGEVCNAGTINNEHILVTAGGIFENFASVDADSFLVNGPFSLFDNRGDLSCERLAVNDSAGISNQGTITCNFLGDSAASFFNVGNITVNYDLSNGYNAYFQNGGYLHIGRDFYNGYDASFSTTCVITVLRDWYNSAQVTGVSGPSCSGFKISNDSYNSGLVVFADLCDLNTSGTIDGNSGTLTMVTHCTCNNFCQVIASVNEQHDNNFLAVYPNPANERIVVETKNNFSGFVQLQNIQGKIISEQYFSAAKFEIQISDFSNGFYLLTLYSDQGEFIGAKRISIAE